MSDEPATVPGTPPAAVTPTGSAPPAIPHPPVAAPTGLSLSGRVTTRAGRALAEATVTVLGLDGRGAGRATTNREGRYQVAALPGGVYAVAAQLAPHRPAAMLLSLSSGQAVLDLCLTGRGTLTGRVVTGMDRIALADVPIRLLGEDGRTAATVFSGADGTYRFTEVDEGERTVAVQSPRYREATVTVRVGAEAETVADVVLEGNGSIRGQVTAPGATPVPGSRVLLLDSAGDVRASVLTDPAGGYHFGDVPTGGYAVVVLDLTPAVSGIRVTASEVAVCDLRVREQLAPSVGSPMPSVAVAPSVLAPLMPPEDEATGPPRLGPQTGPGAGAGPLPRGGTAVGGPGPPRRQASAADR